MLTKRFAPAPRPSRFAATEIAAARYRLSRRRRVVFQRWHRTCIRICVCGAGVRRGLRQAQPERRNIQPERRLGLSRRLGLAERR